jgi:hypothetical protein
MYHYYLCNRMRVRRMCDELHTKSLYSVSLRTLLVLCVCKTWCAAWAKRLCDSKEHCCCLLLVLLMLITGCYSITVLWQLMLQWAAAYAAALNVHSTTDLAVALLSHTKSYISCYNLY